MNFLKYLLDHHSNNPSILNMFSLIREKLECERATIHQSAMPSLEMKRWSEAEVCVVTAFQV